MERGGQKREWSLRAPSPPLPPYLNSIAFVSEPHSGWPWGGGLQGVSGQNFDSSPKFWNVCKTFRARHPLSHFHWQVWEGKLRLLLGWLWLGCSQSTKQLPDRDLEKQCALCWKVQLENISNFYKFLREWIILIANLIAFVVVQNWKSLQIPTQAEE